MQQYEEEMRLYTKDNWYEKVEAKTKKLRKNEKIIYFGQKYVSFKGD